MKKMQFIIPVISILIVVIILAFVFTQPKEEGKKHVLDKREMVEEVIKDVFYNDSVTMEELKDVIGTYMPRGDVFIGTGSILREKPSKELVDKYKLKKFESIQNEYSKNVEKKFRDNTTYVATETTDKYVDFDVVPWYYYQYTRDLVEVTKRIFEYADYTFSEEDYDKDEFIVTEYKARVLALRIMDSHLDTYDNVDKETRKVYVRFDGDKPREKEYFTLYEVLCGYTSERGPGRENRKDRVDRYIEKAKQDGILDETRPLEIVG